MHEAGDQATPHNQSYSERWQLYSKGSERWKELSASDEGISKDRVNTEGSSQAGSSKQLKGPKKAAIKLTPAKLESLSARTRKCGLYMLFSC